MLLSLLACTRPPAPPMLLVSSEAKALAVVAIDGEPLLGPGPWEAEGVVTLNGAELDPVPEGALRYVEVDASGRLVEDDWSFGTDLDPDAALVSPVGEEPRLWEALGAREEPDGLLRLESADVWEDTLLDAELPVDEVLPVWLDEPGDAREGGPLGGSAVGAARGGREGGAGGWALPQGFDAPSTDEEDAGAEAAPEDAPVPALDLPTDTGPALEWVGVWGDADDCLLLDLSGGWQLCSRGLGHSLGRWHVEGDTLWLDDGAYPLDRDALAIELGAGRLFPVHAPEAR